MKKKALFTIKQGGWFETGLMSLGAALIFFVHGEFVLGAIFCVSVGWLYRTLAFRYVRITGKFITGFCYERPLRKTYGYPYADIVQVYIPPLTRQGWRMEFIFRGGASITSSVTDDLEAICQHFIDKQVAIETGSSDLREMLVRYNNRLKIDPHKQIAIRKAREAARKIKLHKRRGI